MDHYPGALSALRGQLVEQDVDDEPVAAFLDRVEAARSEALTSNGWRIAQSAGRIRKEEMLWRVPATWAWVRLEAVAFPQAGFAFQSHHFNHSGRGTPLIRIRDIGNRGAECHYDGAFRREFLVEPGDYLVGMDGNFNIRRWAGPSALLNQRVTRLIFFGQETKRPFITWALQRRINALHGSRAYTTVQHLSGKQIAAAVIPIPPLPEQERIVSKVDELMRLCDEFEDRKQRRHRAITEFRGSALHALTEAETPDDLLLAWRRVSANWPALTDNLDSISFLRRTILQLAVRGKLSPQDPHERPASDLLVDIAEQQLDLKAGGTLLGVRLPILPPSIPAPPLPEGWAWTRLGAVLRHCRNGLAAKPNDNGIGFPLLRISAGTSDPDGRVVLDDHKFTEIDHESAAPFLLDQDDLLACRFNGNLHYVGRVAIVPEHKGVYLHPDKLIRMMAILTEHRYLMIALNSTETRAQIEEAASTTAGNIGINGAQLQALHIALPPPSEQARIAERVERLLRLCTALADALPLENVAAGRAATRLIHTLLNA